MQTPNEYLRALLLELAEQHELTDSAIARAHKTLRNLRWFEVIRTSGHIDNGKVKHYQVTLSVGFTMEMPG